MSFTERLIPPQSGNKYYTRKEEGGYSPCILGNDKIVSRPWKGSTLPNCVGYATGRFNEIGGYKTCKYLGNANAKNFIKLAQSQKLTISDKPTLGACIVWSTNGAGHVGIVEEIISATEIIISESGWSSKKPFWTAHHKRGANGQWCEGDDYSWMKTGYTFIGFIVNPAVPPDFIPVLKKGSKGIYVKDLQENLNTIGNYGLIVDGSFGEATEKAVKDFQKKHGISVDGLVGPATQKAIAAALLDLQKPDGVYDLYMTVNGQQKIGWGTLVDEEQYVRIKDLVELGLAKKVEWNPITKQLNITT